MTDKLLGKYCPEGPGGRDCSCCGQAPGRSRKEARRRIKRRERQEWRTEAREVTA